MASLQKKKIHGKEYWYIVECRRINGKPRPVVLQYLGSVNSLLDRLQRKKEQKKIRSYSHGTVYALVKIAGEMGLAEILSKHLPAQKRDGLNVSDTIIIGAIHRIIQPGSKRSFSGWAKETTLPKLLGFNAQQITSQHFWDQMDTVGEKHIEAIEDEIARKLAQLYDIGYSVLFYDTTNFYTYIATKNTKVNLAQRGYNKQKRDDLRQFNLALVTTKEFLFPLFSYLYEGNKNDVSIFSDYTKKMLQRLKGIICQIQDVTFIFDKGNNSTKGIATLQKEHVGYVGTLSIYTHKDLINIPGDKYCQIELSDGKKVLVSRTEKVLWGEEHSIVIKKSQQLKEGQTRGFLKDIEKKISLLEKLKEKLASSKSRHRNQEKLKKLIDSILSGQFIKEVLKVTITQDCQKKGRFDISWEIDEEKKHHIINDIFGKKVFFTNRIKWTEREIVEAYHGQSKIERVFRHLKNPYHFTVRPQFHWTDQKIRVHTFMCLLGLLLAEILRKKVFDAGIKLSLDDILDTLSNIRESVAITYTAKKGRPRVDVQLEEMDDVEKMLFQIVEKTAI